MRRVVSFLAVSGLVAGALAYQQTVNQLQQEGKTISTNLRVVDGTLMVPVKDVAAYLGGKLSVANGTATITGGGTTSPGMGGFTGAAQPLISEPKLPDPKQVSLAVGQTAENAGYEFGVTGIADVPKGAYKTTYDPSGRKISPSAKDERLVIVRMRVENRSGEVRRPPLSTAPDMTLFDERGVGVPALAYDARPVGPTTIEGMDNDLLPYSSFDVPLLAPQGAIEFAAVFSLPKERSAKRLAVGFPSTSQSDGGMNVMVSLG